MTKVLFILFCLVGSTAFAQATGPAEQKTAYRLAKLFYAARAAIGERTSFTSDPTSPANNREQLLDSIKLSFDRMAGEPLKPDSDAHVANLWKAINNVVDNAMKGGYKGRWSDHPNFPGILIPARFGSEVTKEFNQISEKSKMKWTTSDEYLVNPVNRADAWEQETIANKFKSAKWTQGAPYFDTVKEESGTVYRYALPEYFKTSCMNCHGGEMGKKIHRGKGAAGSNTFGGLLSVRIQN